MKNIKLSQIRKKIADYDSKREDLIKKSRDLLKSSKKLIYDLQRDDNKNISLSLKSVKKHKDDVDRIAGKDEMLKYEGSYSDANQEYVEAMTFYSYLYDKKFPFPKDLKVSETDYLLGLCDLTGELTRKAVLLSIKNKAEDVRHIRDFIDNLHGEFLQFNLRNSQLRKKYDSIKYNLAKVEDLLLKLK